MKWCSQALLQMSRIMDLHHRSEAVLTVLATLHTPWEPHSLLLSLRDLANILQLTRSFETEILINFSLLQQYKCYFLGVFKFYPLPTDISNLPLAYSKYKQSKLHHCRMLKTWECAFSCWTEHILSWILQLYQIPAMQQLQEPQMVSLWPLERCRMKTARMQGQPGLSQEHLWGEESQTFSSGYECLKMAPTF